VVCAQGKEKVYREEWVDGSLISKYEIGPEVRFQLHTTVWKTLGGRVLKRSWTLVACACAQEVPHILDNEIDASLSTLKSGLKNAIGGSLASNASMSMSSSRAALALAPSNALVPFNGLQGINLQSMGIILDLGYALPIDTASSS
jgi:hypothetical protein